MKMEYRTTSSSGPSGSRDRASRRGHAPSGSPGTPLGEGQFDMVEWYPQFQSCVRYFVDHAQYSGPVQAMAAFINIRLPFQTSPSPVLSSNQQNSPQQPAAAIPGVAQSQAAAGPAAFLGPSQAAAGTYPFVTLIPYIRRLVVTGFDFPAILHGFFGDDWAAGIGPLHETERRNYMFAAKSDSWIRVKASYDMNDEQMVPFLRPLQGVSEMEIVAAEGKWSEWLAMQDWMLGPRALEREGAIVKEEAD